MPPNKIQQQQRDEQTAALREVFTEFSQDLRQIMQDSVTNTVRAVLQAQAQVQPIRPNRNDPAFDEDSDGDDENPFAVGNQQRQHQQRALDVTTNRFKTEQPASPTAQLDASSAVTTLKPTRSLTFKCFNCGETGHRQASCPKRVLFAKQRQAETEEKVVGDTGIALVTWRNFLRPQVIKESWLRTNVFRSTCTIRGKVCRLIIDSGCCTNIVSEEAVTKLALVTEPHPTPYRVAWLNTKTELRRISKRCRVPFSIGSTYKDLVCCDVIPMDACHILLGRPWQYDRRTMHDGFANTYSFSFEGNRITLHPARAECNSIFTS